MTLSATALPVNRKRVIALTAILLSATFLWAGKASAKKNMPAFAELDDISQATIGRICMNQVIRIPENMQKNIGIGQKEEIMKCMIYYRESFNATQLAIVKCYWLSGTGDELMRCLKGTEEMPY